MLKRPRGTKMLVFTVILVLPLGFILYGYGYIGASSKLPYPQFPDFTSEDRILIVSPHPDDEGLALTGIIRSAVQEKIPLLLVMMTNGDGNRRNTEVFFKTTKPTAADFRRLGVMRHQETINAMRQLGLNEKDIIFLSYPDGGINSLFDSNWDPDHLHLGANGATSAPYPFAYEKNAPYYGQNVVKNLEEIARRFKPNVVFYPDPEDDHHDHWATSAFVQYVLTEIGYRQREFTYLVHKGFNWPFPWLYTPARWLLPPRGLRKLDAKWQAFPLSNGEEPIKHRVVNLYRSQKDLMEPFLDAFVRKNELFASYPDIRITPVKREPYFFSGKSLPHPVFKDPVGDTLIRELGGWGDLTAVGFALGKKNAWLALESRQGISPQVIYAFHLRIFGSRGVKRVDVRVQNGVAVSPIYAKNSIKIAGPIPLKSGKDRLVVELPASLFKDADRFLLNADTINGQIHRRIDRTAWRRIIL